MSSVNVVIRFRGGERGQPDDFAPWLITPQTIELEGRGHTFNFDAVLGNDNTQADLYQASGFPIINKFMDGFNSTIFAYGQSGSGKTFSMLGPEEVTEMIVNGVENVPQDIQDNYGITPRSTFHMFDIINQGIRQGSTFNVKCSYIEIYNESINDILLNPPATGLKVRELPNVGMSVMGMTEQSVTMPEELFDCLAVGTANRIVCSTGQNARSSRSHTVFIVIVEQKLVDGSTKISKLNLVDLAGSEKLSKTGAKGQALKEAQNINLSLTTLGRCIKALTAGGAQHIPFRESKLTQILKESLGGNAVTTLICTGSRKKVHKEETIGTLQFAERAKMVQNKVKSNVKRSAEELEKMVSQLKVEVSRLRKQLSDVGIAEITDGSIAETDDTEHEGPSSAAVGSIEYQELKVRYETLESNSQQQIMDLSARLEVAEANAQNTDYLSMHEELEDFRDRLEAKEKQVNDLYQQKIDLKESYDLQITDMQTQQENLNIQIIKITEEKNYASQKLTDVKEELDKLNQKHEALIIEKNSLSENAIALQERIYELESLLESEKAQRQALQTQLAETRMKLHEIQEKLTEADKQIEELRQQINKQNEEIEELNSTIAKLKKSNERLEKEQQTLAKQYSDLQDANKKSQMAFEEEILRLKNENSGLSSENFSLKDEIATAKSELNSLKQMLNENISSREALEEREQYLGKVAEGYENTIKRITSEKQQLEENNSKLYEQLAHARTTEENQMDQISALKSTLSMISEQSNDAHQRVKELETSKADMEARISGIQQDLSVSKNKISKIKAKKWTLQETVSSVTAERDQLQGEKARVEEAFAKSKDANAEHIQNFKNEIQELKQTLQQKEHDNSNAIEGIQVKLTEALTEIARLKDLLEKRDQTLKQNKKHESRLKAEISHQKVLIAKLEGDVKLKDKQRQVERRNSFISQNSGRLRRATSILRQAQQSQTGNMGGNAFGVVLRKTDNSHLKAAVEQAKKVAEMTPESEFKVYYGFEEIRSLYVYDDDPTPIDEEGSGGSLQSSSSEDEQML